MERWEMAIKKRGDLMQLSSGWILPIALVLLVVADWLLRRRKAKEIKKNAKV